MVDGKGGIWFHGSQNRSTQKSEADIIREVGKKKFGDSLWFSVAIILLFLGYQLSGSFIRSFSFD